MKTEPENELKHERSESEPSEEEHKPKTKQPKTSTKNNSSTASTGTAASRPVGATGKTILAEKIVKAGIAAVQRDIDATAAETGLTPRQIRSQLQGNRANLRRALLDVVKKIG